MPGALLWTQLAPLTWLCMMVSNWKEVADHMVNSPACRKEGVGHHM
jgi:hypothetical protein